MQADGTSNPPDDYQLMAGIASEDRAAFTTLYDRHATLIFTVCLRILHDRSEAEDLLIEFFSEVWEKASRFDATRGSPVTYLLTLARSRAIDRLRRRRVDKSARESRDTSAEIDQPSPLADCLDRERCGVIREAVNGLDDAQRQAIECSFYDGLTHPEIADKLGKPLGTIKTNIRQGLIRLRDQLRTVYRSTQP